jgi:hypothetical protein
MAVFQHLGQTESEFGSAVHPGPSAPLTLSCSAAVPDTSGTCTHARWRGAAVAEHTFDSGGILTQPGTRLRRCVEGVVGTGVSGHAQSRLLALSRTVTRPARDPPRSGRPATGGSRRVLVRRRARRVNAPLDWLPKAFRRRILTGRRAGPTTEGRSPRQVIPMERSGRRALPKS